MNDRKLRAHITQMRDAAASATDLILEDTPYGTAVVQSQPEPSWVADDDRSWYRGSVFASPPQVGDTSGRCCGYSRGGSRSSNPSGWPPATTPRTWPCG